MSAKWFFTFKHFKFPLLPLLTHSAMGEVAPVTATACIKPIFKTTRQELIPGNRCLVDYLWVSYLLGWAHPMPFTIPEVK